MIHTQEEYRAALFRIDSLMDGEHKTEDLYKLVDAVVAYEAQQYPIEKPTKQEAQAFREENT